MRKPRPRKTLGPDSKCMSWTQNRIKYSLTMSAQNECFMSQAHKRSDLDSISEQFLKRKSYIEFDL